MPGSCLANRHIPSSGVRADQRTWTSSKSIPSNSRAKVNRINFSPQITHTSNQHVPLTRGGSIFSYTACKRNKLPTRPNPPLPDVSGKIPPWMSSSYHHYCGRCGSVPSTYLSFHFHSYTFILRTANEMETSRGCWHSTSAQSYLSTGLPLYPVCYGWLACMKQHTIVHCVCKAEQSRASPLAWTFFSEFD